MDNNQTGTSLQVTMDSRLKVHPVLLSPSGFFVVRSFADLPGMGCRRDEPDKINGPEYDVVTHCFMPEEGIITN